MASDRVELQVFYCKEAYVYQIPSATTVGHRADTWDVNHWLCEVSVRVVTHEDECFVRLEDCKTGELFAECPVPRDAPLITVIEPVIDSSRYFVLRIVDRDTDRHAFIGLGFRERGEASNFNAALYEHAQYLKKKRVAEAQRKEFEEREQRASEGAEAAEGEALPSVDYSIKPGEKITIKLNVAKQDKAEGFLSKGSKLGARFNLFAGSEGSAGGLALSPPPAPKLMQHEQPSGSTAEAAAAAAAAMSISPRGHQDATAAGGSDVRGDGLGPSCPGGNVAASGDAGGASPAAAEGQATEGEADGVAETASQKLQQLGLGAGGGQAQREGLESRGGGEGAVAAAGTADEDDWGDFTSS